MTTEVQFRQDNQLGAQVGNISVFSTSGTAASTNLDTELGADACGDFLSLVCDQDLNYSFSSSGVTASIAATSGDGRTAFLPANTVLRFRLPSSEQSGRPAFDTILNHIAAGVGTIRVWRSSGER